MVQMVPPHQMNEIVAHSSDVDKGLGKFAAGRARKASSTLGAHRHSGKSRITIEKGLVDYYIILDDTADLRHALSIEYGRRLPGGGRSDPVLALHAALGLKGPAG